jgi:hypothetical protein
MNRSRVVLLIVFPLMGGWAMAQKHFSFDQPETFKRTVKLPNTAVVLLTRELQTVPGCDERPSSFTPTFQASRINLGANRPALIAMAGEDCSHGADRFRFWILLKKRRSYRSLLRAGSESLTVRKTRTHGLPDIETNSATAEGGYTNIYKFDGTVYKVVRCTHTAFATRKTDLLPCRTQ